MIAWDPLSKWNAITDVAGVLVGHSTIIRGAGPLRRGKGPVRTGVTAILPNEQNIFEQRLIGGGFVLNGAGDVKAPRALHPAFYGSYDWHSSVHGHWMLVRLLRTFPDLPEQQDPDHFDPALRNRLRQTSGLRGKKECQQRQASSMSGQRQTQRKFDAVHLGAAASAINDTFEKPA